MMFKGKPTLISVGSHATYCYDALTGKELWRTEFLKGHSGSLTPVIGDDLVYTGTGHGDTQLWAIRPGGTGVVTDTHVVWRDKVKIPTRPSPVLVNGLLYMTNDAGIVSCVDAKTGEEVFHGRIEGQFSASPIYANGRVYFFGEKGHSTVIEAGREFKVLGESQMGTGWMATPAVSGDAFYLRSRTDLYCVENMGK